MTEVNILKLPECPEFLDKALTTPAKEIGSALGNIFYTVFYPINYIGEKLRIRQAENLKKYQADLNHELSQIPEEKLVEPRLSVVGPALEASKFYIEEEEIRKMFAKLIASSMNSDSYSKVHHSFVEIIKQLSPLDASNLKFIDGRLPIVEYKVSFKDGSHIPLKTNVFISNTGNSNIDSNASSISNLNRLGLVSLIYDNHFTDAGRYSIFEQIDYYTDIKNNLNKELYKDAGLEFDSLDTQKGIIRLTPFGENFKSICL